MSETKITYTTGTLAYLDTFTGLVPCKVITVTKAQSYIPGIVEYFCEVLVTARRKGYYKGERFTVHADRVIPRKMVYTRCGQYRIRGGYRWIVSK